jgi:hypothetical protein
MAGTSSGSTTSADMAVQFAMKSLTVGTFHERLSFWAIFE